MTGSSFGTTLAEAVRCGIQGMAVRTTQRDHARAVDAVRAVAEDLKAKFAVWDPNDGLTVDGQSPIAGTVNLVTCLRTLVTSRDALPERTVVAIKWGADSLRTTPAARALLCDLVAAERFQMTVPKAEEAPNYFTRRRPVVFIFQAGDQVPGEVTQHLMPLPWRLPGAADMAQTFDRIQEALSDQPDARRQPTADEKARTLHALQGMDQQNAADVLAMAARVCRRLVGDDAVRMIYDAKDELLVQTTALRPVPWDQIPLEGDLVGMDQLIPWAKTRAIAYTPAARAKGVAPPRAVLLAGVTGTGKTEVAKVISRITGKKMYMLDWGALKGSLVGESERRMRETLAAVDALGDSLLFLDEMEKALAGSGGQGGKDTSGVSQALLGELLKWLTTHRTETLFVGTCNLFGSMPSELLSRFTKIWGVDLPDAAERWEIIKVHCRRKGIPFAGLEPLREQILAASVDYAGRDLVFALEEAHSLSLLNAGAQFGVPTGEQVLAGIRSVKPAIQKDPEGVEAQRDLVRRNTTPVSAARAKDWEKPEPARRGRQKGGRPVDPTDPERN